MPNTDTAAAEAPITPATLLALPAPILLHTLSFLPPKGMTRVIQTCKTLQTHASTNTLWKEKLERHFPDEAAAASTEVIAIDYYHTEFIKAATIHYEGLSARRTAFFVQTKEGESSDYTASIPAERVADFIERRDRFAGVVPRVRDAIYWATRLGHQHLLDIWYQRISELYRNDDESLDFTKKDAKDHYLLYWMIVLNQLEALQDTAAQWEPIINQDCTTGKCNEEKPLHLAARCGHADVVALFLSHTDSDGNRTCDVNATDNFDCIALHVAADNGHADIVALFLNHTDSDGNRTYDVNATNEFDETALHGAAKKGHTDIVKLLLAHTDEQGQHISNIEIRAEFGGTALDLAVTKGHIDIVNILTWHRITLLQEQKNASATEVVIAIAASLIPSTERGDAAQIQLPGTTASSSDPFTEFRTRFADITADNAEDAARAIVTIVSDRQSTIAESAIASTSTTSETTSETETTTRKRMETLKGYIFDVLFEPAIRQAAAETASAAVAPAQG